jgi:hypothetical protein
MLRCTGHAPNAAARTAAAHTLATLRTRYRNDPAAALTLAGAGARADDPITTADVAAFVLMANACLNLDATLCID